MDDISPQAVLLTLSREKSSIAIVLLRREDQGNIIYSIAAWEVEGVLGRVGDDIATGLAHVGIFSSLLVISTLSTRVIVA